MTLTHCGFLEKAPERMAVAMRAEVSEGSIVAGYLPGGAGNTRGKLSARELVTFTDMYTPSASVRVSKYCST